MYIVIETFGNPVIVQDAATGLAAIFDDPAEAHRVAQTACQRGLVVNISSHR